MTPLERGDDAQPEAGVVELDLAGQVAATPTFHPWAPTSTVTSLKYQPTPAPHRFEKKYRAYASA